MPQLEQIAATYGSQFFWLFVTFGLVYLVIGRGMLPRIEATVEARDVRIAGDLAAAADARTNADAIEDAYRARIDASRADGLRVAAEAKAASARTTEARIAEADRAIDAVTGEAERRLAAATASAQGEVEGVAASATQDLVARLAGVSVGRSEATRAVKAALARG